MPAGIITLNIQDGDGTLRSMRFWSSDGTAAGELSPVAANGAALDGVDGAAIVPPVGGSGIRGWLSGIYNVLANLGAKLGAGEAHIGAVGGHSAVAGGNFARPADTTVYASGDIVANSTVGANVVPIAISAARLNGGTGMLRRMRLSKSGPSLVNASFRVHIFKTSPTLTAGDNASINGAVNGVASIHLGYFDITMDQSFSDGAKGISSPSVGSEIVFDTAAGSTNLYALIEARAAYAPLSGETFTVAAEILRD